MSDLRDGGRPESLPLRPVLTLAVARRIVATAQNKARDDGLGICVAVVDPGGHLLELSRMDGLHVGTVDVSIGKARAAALFKKTTEAFAAALASGAAGLVSLPGMLPVPGGVPLFCDGVLVGAVGISGATPQQDAEMAELAAGVAPTGGEVR